MISNQNFEQVLRLGESWEVTEANYDSVTEAFSILVAETELLWSSEICPNCGAGAVACYDHVAIRRWRHANGFDKLASIACALPRGRCGSCSRVYRIKPPWAGKSKCFTRDFEALALQLMQDLPIRRVSRLLCETDHRLWRMLFAHADKVHKDLSAEALRHLQRRQMKPIQDSQMGAAI